MVQEVQQQGNWYQDPNRIEGIGHIERKLSEHTQIRARTTRGTMFVGGNMTIVAGGGEVFVPSWSYTDSEDVYYKVIGGDIYMSQGGGYEIHIIPTKGYADLHECVFRLYVDGKEVYKFVKRLSALENDVIALNLGKKNKITASFTPNDGVPSTNISVTLKFIKL